MRLGFAALGGGYAAVRVDGVVGLTPYWSVGTGAKGHDVCYRERSDPCQQLELLMRIQQSHRRQEMRWASQELRGRNGDM